jgi:hypothetical protein
LTGDKRIVFGCGEGKDITFYMNGDRVISRHFDIDFSSNSLIMRNLNLDCAESCGIYKRVFDDELFCLRPGNAFRIGTLEFLVERYNTGVVSDIGQR